MKHILKAVAVVMLLMFTTGIVLPWIISTVILPLWMIIFSVGAVIFLWFVVLDKTFRKSLVFAFKYFNKKDSANVD